MSADEFEKQPRGRRHFDLWRARTPLDSSIGAFEIEMNAPPDEELLARANELASAVSVQDATILKLIYANYLRAVENQIWMNSCDVPCDLEEDQISRYLRSRSISVWRDSKGRVSAGIFIRPMWDTEHGIDIGMVEGRVVLQRI